MWKLQAPLFCYINFKAFQSWARGLCPQRAGWLAEWRAIRGERIAVSCFVRSNLSCPGKVPRHFIGDVKKRKKRKEKKIIRECALSGLQLPVKKCAASFWLSFIFLRDCLFVSAVSQPSQVLMTQVWRSSSAKKKNYKTKQTMCTFVQTGFISKIPSNRKRFQSVLIFHSSHQ